MAHLLEYNWGKYYNRFINLYFVRKKMKIISRKEEKKELEYSERSRKSELICVYGRRRVGTTQALKIIMISAKGLSGTTHTSYIADVITLDDLFEG